MSISVLNIRKITRKGHQEWKGGKKLICHSFNLTQFSNLSVWGVNGIFFLLVRSKSNIQGVFWTLLVGESDVDELLYVDVWSAVENISE